MENFIKDLKRLDELEKDIIEKTDELLDRDFNIIFQNAGCLRLRYKDYDCYVEVHMEKDWPGTMIESYNIEDEYVWHYLNRVFFNNPKSIIFKIRDYINFKSIKLNDETMKKIDEIYNNEEYITLKNKIYDE